MNKSEPEVPLISMSNTVSVPAASVTKLSQQLQDLSVASPEVGLNVPAIPVSPVAHARDTSIPSAIYTHLPCLYPLTIYRR
jgi:hypothetical protein